MKRGRVLAAGAAFFLLVCACAPPQPNKLANLSSPTPSPSPTPTTPVSASAQPFHVGEVGLVYAPVTITPSGGVTPYAWSISDGALPGGLALGSDGKVSGTPTAAGTFTFTIKLADYGDSFAGIQGKITIVDALTALLRPECASYCNVELGCTNACGDFGSLSGGVGPFSFSVVGGTVPLGTSVVGFSLSGTFTGASGWVQFTVQASDSLGATTTISPRFWMYDHIALSAGGCQSRLSCTFTLTYTGGTPGPLPTVAPAGWVGAKVCGTITAGPIVCPEPQFSAVVQPGTATVTLTYLQGYSNTTGTLTVQVTDNSLCAANTRCTASAQVQVVG